MDQAWAFRQFVYFLGVMTAKFYSIIRLQPINFCMHMDIDIGRSSPFFIKYPHFVLLKYG